MSSAGSKFGILLSSTLILTQNRFSVGESYRSRSR
jgi:hypothetical protein